MNAFCSIVSFRNHIHFQLCEFNRVSLADHCAEHAVTAEGRVSGNEQITEVSRIIDIAADRMNRGNEALYFANRIRDEYSLKVVTVSDSMTDAACNRNYIF